MGDRANVAIQFEGGKRVYLYTHWGGSELPALVQKSLDRDRDRWQDPSYLARIIFCDMISGNIDSLTGFGIAPYIMDNEHPVVVVDCEKKMVYFEEATSKVIIKWTFEEFLKADIKDEWF